MLRHLRRGPGFYKRLFALALPLILQNLITTSLGFVDTFMVGMLGQNELSAVTAANTPHLHAADHHSRPAQRPLRSGQPVLGQGGHGEHQPLYGRQPLRRIADRSDRGRGAVLLPPPGHGPCDQQRPAHRAGGPVPADRGAELHLQHHQLRLHRHAAQHGESRHGHGGLRHLHADQHLPELHPDLRQVRRAGHGHHRRRHRHPDLPGGGGGHRGPLCPPLPPGCR